MIKIGNLNEYNKNRQMYLESEGWTIINIHYALVYKEDTIEKLKEIIQ